MDHLTPMGVAAAYLGELVTEELKAHEASRPEGLGGGGRADEAPSKIVVVAPQEGQVSWGVLPEVLVGVLVPVMLQDYACS